MEDGLLPASAASARRGGANVGIVSTHRYWTSESEAWARYHLDLGFKRLYVFVDEAQRSAAAPPPAVELTLRTPAHWSSHSLSRGFDDYLQDIRRDVGGPLWGSPERVMQRQVLNACDAMDRAAAEGLDWLLHIDDDEYFWCPDATVDEHFQCLSGAGLSYARYINHEAVLTSDPLPASTGQALFKKHSWGLTAAQQAALAELLPGKPYYSSHPYGKSAVRVGLEDRPQGVHGFEMADPMHNLAMFKVPAILHRPYKSVDQFCDKHLSQGSFPMDMALGSPYIPPGVYGRAHELTREQDIDGMRALYAESVLWSPAEAERLRAGGYLLSIAPPWST